MSSEQPESCGEGFPDLREVARQDMMQALGMLSAGIAHEISTPLGAIGCSQSTQQAAHRKLAERLAVLAPDALADDELQRILEVLDKNDGIVTAGLQRVLELVRQLKRFLHEDDPRPGPVDIAATVDGVLLLAGHRLRDGVRVVREDGGAPAALGHPNQVSQILLNLAVNAAQALGDGGGTVTFGAGVVDDMVTVTVADDGPGVAPENAGRIFQFGFTTRHEDGGTGFGLSLSRHLAGKMGGDLAHDDTPGGGATFTLSLPRAGSDPRSGAA